MISKQLAVECCDKGKNALCCWKTIFSFSVWVFMSQVQKFIGNKEHQQYTLFQFGYTFNLQEEHCRGYGCYQPESGKRESKIEHWKNNGYFALNFTLSERSNYVFSFCFYVFESKKSSRY